jgi:MFS family permease
MAVFFAAAILYYTDRFILNLLVDPIRADLHISDTQISLLQGAAFALVYAFAGLPFGRLADVLPRRAVIMAGVVTWSVATVACGFAHSFGQLFVARIGVGIGEAALAPAAVSMIGDYFPPQRRGAAIGVFLTGMSIGSGMAIVVGGGLLQAADAGLLRSLPVIGAMAPWRAVLVLLGLPGLAIVGLLFSIREPQRRDRASATGAALPLKTVIGEFVRLRRVLAPLYLALALSSAGDIALQAWTPALLSRRFGFSPGHIGGTLGLVAIVTGVTGSVFGGVVSDQMAKRGGPRARVLLALAACLLGVGGAAVGLAANGFQVIALYTVWMLMITVSETIAITLVQEVAPNEMRGVAASVVSFGNILIGFSLGTTLTAVFTDDVYRNPLSVGLSITSVAAPAGILAIFMLWRVLVGLKIEAQVPIA